MKVLGALVAALVFYLIFASPAHANSLRVSCEIYDTNREDQVAFADHLHQQFGNTSHTDLSTADRLYAHKDTSCETGGKWWTNAGWLPVERYEPVPSVIVYYRAPGDQTKIVNIRQGMELIAKTATNNKMDELLYSCGSSPGDAQPTQATPPYGCTSNWSTNIKFPRCWDGVGIEHTDFAYGPNRTTCTRTHPYMLPEINYLVRHPNTDGKVPNPLQISMGVDEWGDYTMTHADYVFAAQDEFNKAVDLDGDGRIEHRDSDGDGSYEPWQDGGDSESALHDLCLKEAPDNLEFNNARCRAGGLLSWHVRALKNYYG